MDLRGKLALVTGSTSGIGLQIAHALSKAGCDVIITGFGDKKEIKDIVDTIKRQYGVHAEYIPANLERTDDIELLVSQILDLHPQGIDILINNAGDCHIDRVEDFPVAKWDNLMALNLSAPFHLIKRFLPGMKNKGWGRIVNTSSQLGHISFPGYAPYSATKTGLIGLTKNQIRSSGKAIIEGVALEAAQYGITCNAVCPTVVKTKLADDVLEAIAKMTNSTADEVMRDLKTNIPTGKADTPEQVAELVLFLVSSGASDQMTGSSYLIDGGYTAK